MNIEYDYSLKIKRVVREDGFRVFIFTDLMLEEELNIAIIEPIIAVSIVGKFNFELLTHLSSIEMLTIMDINVTAADSKYLAVLTKLKRLVLVDCFVVDAFDFGIFKNLEELDLNWKSDYSLSSNWNLKELIIRKVDTFDLNFIAKNINLVKLEIIGGRVGSIKGIEGLINLKALTLFRLSKLVDINSLLNLPELEYIDFRSIRMNIDILSFTNFKNLKWLVMENCPAILHTSEIIKFTSLKGVIILKRTKLTDEEREITHLFSSTKYGYFRIDDVRNGLLLMFNEWDLYSDDK